MGGKQYLQTGSSGVLIPADSLALGGSDRARLVPFTLDCYYVDFDGTNFVRVLKKFEIPEFKDAMSVRGLPILPISVAVQEGLINIEDVRTRASAFIAYTRSTYSYYRGRSICREPDGELLRRVEKGGLESTVVFPENIESPIVVDFERCFQEQPSWKPCRASRELSTLRHIVIPSAGMDDDRVWDLRMAERVLEYTDQSQSIELHSRVPPTGDDLLLLPDRLFAYVLRTRQWEGSQSENYLTGIEADHTAWDLLQIDSRHKSIIQALMATHFRKKKPQRRQFDLVQDKGKGLIILLHGVPGVGKTSTAETVAQFYNKPLLPITCGDLGLTSIEVEKNLQKSFQLAQAWECVLLLDEADVFLAERTQDNLERNALVSVFLRVMEYYEGILFLTTNKVGAFDDAFKSRISMSLYYPPLQQHQTEKIWDMQIKRTEKLSREANPDDESQHVKFNHDEVMAMAREIWSTQQNHLFFQPVWNGRQIRNAFQTAVALAEWHQQEDKVPGPIRVKGEHFYKVSIVSNEFNAYLWSVTKQKGEAGYNFYKGYRYDGFDPGQPAGPGWRSAKAQQQQQAGIGMDMGGQGMWNSPQSSMMGMGMNAQPGGLGAVSFGGNNKQNQGGFASNHGLNQADFPSGRWQTNSGAMGNPGVSGPMGGLGGGMLNASIGGQVGMGMPSANVQTVPGQGVGMAQGASGQTADQQQRQQQQQQQQYIGAQTGLQNGGGMRLMPDQGNPQVRSNLW
ncbi:hypothetical protein CTRI78_v000001 [Colletotrichum trifolii]|uniref:AAA+ ATPase domain-containing protein n=1 Tax=Colletotrichum trifolii TaxID=5466 RepID=A0A4R8RSU8_COLTR|nr:hypothetical protein CTRI78_v000001 [Colletotrichum trifolii]